MSPQEALARIRIEYERAAARHGAFNSGHEGYAVIREELDELWDEVKTKDARPGGGARDETCDPARNDAGAPGAAGPAGIPPKRDGEWFDRGPTGYEARSAAIAGERPAEPGELCTCGRQAVVVFVAERFGPVGWCGVPDGGRPGGRCSFCGGGDHGEQRCPAYTLRPAPPEGEQP